MEGLDTALIAASLVVWGLVSARLAAFNVSAPIFFVVVGLGLANDPISAITVDVHTETLTSLAEVTLALLLFSDAVQHLGHPPALQEQQRDGGPEAMVPTAPRSARVSSRSSATPSAVVIRTGLTDRTGFPASARGARPRPPSRARS